MIQNCTGPLFMLHLISKKDFIIHLYRNVRNERKGRKVYKCFPAFLVIQLFFLDHEGHEEPQRPQSINVSFFAKNFASLAILFFCSLDFLVFCKNTEPQSFQRIF